MKPTHIICHYSEIGLKGDNRYFFEKKLADNIKKSLSLAEIEINPQIISGSIIADIVGQNEKDIKKALECVCGMHHFSLAEMYDPDINLLGEKILFLLKDKKFKSFKIDTKRSDKSHPVKSMDINKDLGAVVVKEMNKKVKLDNPDITVFIEIVKISKNTTKALVFTEKVKGVGGLPVGSGGKALSLISGGLDSPVSSFMCMKRGVKNDFIHFHSYPHTTKESIIQVKDTIKTLNKFQINSTIYWVPFAETQKKIVAKAPEPYRVILYRRYMMKIASKIAKEKGLLSLITGDSIGQVSSQTLENILAVSEAAKLPIIRPLAGMDKEEIIKISKKIGTYNISIRPCEDTCSRFMPARPITKAKLSEVKKIEKILDSESMVKECLENINIEQIQEVHKDNQVL